MASGDEVLRFAQDDRKLSMTGKPFTGVKILDFTRVEFGPQLVTLRPVGRADLVHEAVRALAPRAAAVGQVRHEQPRRQRCHAHHADECTRRGVAPAVLLLISRICLMMMPVP